MIIFTSSLDFDERIRKEVASLGNLSISDIAIFASEETRSKNPVGHATIVNPRFFIPNREWVPVKLMKIAELFLRLIFQFPFRDYDRIWLHDPIMVFLIPFLKKRSGARIIWDLHELPPPAFFNRPYLKKYFRRSADLADVVITANEERGSYMVRNGLIPNFRVLENFPMRDEQKPDTSFRDAEFEQFVDGRPFAYCQSATHPMRNFMALAKACVEEKQCLIVPGDKNEEYRRARKAIRDFDNHILVLGKKPSMYLDYYLSKARYSFVFYTNKNMNNYLCAPNRLYHSLKLGIPVLVGGNPPLARVIDKYHCGVKLSGFGEDSTEIIHGIRKMNTHYEDFRRNTESISGLFSWDSQDAEIEEIIHFSDAGNDHLNQDNTFAT
ncbi:hypothetical protein QA596_08430 [Balneolales bacterium ANBcel1]|nr:hypothetical protein [Balneolales bacterium ANBcel1]